MDDSMMTVSKEWYKRACKALAMVEHAEALKTEAAHKRLAFDASSVENACKSYENNTKDKGRSGRAFEVAVREYLKGEVSRCRPQGVQDITAKCGGIECKSGAGWIVSPVYPDKEAALEYYKNNRLPMVSRYVIYIPKFYGDISQARCFTQRHFLDILEMCGLIIAKKDNRGVWGIAIQTFYNSNKRMNMFFDALEEGCTLDDFIRSHVI